MSRWRSLLRRWMGDLRAGHLWPGLSVLTLFTYNTWVLWRPVNGHRAIFDGYLSEFSASDQPHSFFFRGGDLITAVIVLGLGVRALTLWRRRRRHPVAAGTRAGGSRAGGGRAEGAVVPDGGTGPRQPGRWWAVAAVFLLVFGVATFFDAFFAMDCSPSLSAQCRLAEETGQLSLVHYAHSFTSVGAQTGIVASMVSTVIASYRSGRPSRARWRFVVVVSVLEVVSLAVLLGMLITGTPGLGYPQVVMVAVASVWFAAIGFRLIGEDAESSAPPVPLGPAVSSEDTYVR